MIPKIQLVLIFFMIARESYALESDAFAGAIACHQNGLISEQNLKYLLDKRPLPHEIAGWFNRPNGQVSTGRYLTQLAKIFAPARSAFPSDLADYFLEKLLVENVAESKKIEAIYRVMLQDSVQAWQGFLELAVVEQVPRKFTESIIVPLALATNGANKKVILEYVKTHYPGAYKPETADINKPQEDDRLYPARTLAFLGQWLIINEALEKNNNRLDMGDYAAIIKNANELFSADYGLDEIRAIVTTLQGIISEHNYDGPVPTLHVIEFYGSLPFGRGVSLADGRTPSDIDLRIHGVVSQKLFPGVPKAEHSRNFVNLFKPRLAAEWSRRGIGSSMPAVQWFPELPMASSSDVSGAIHLIVAKEKTQVVYYEPPKLGSDQQSPRRIGSFNFEMD